MADDKAKVVFEGDASGVERAGQQVNQVISNMRAKLQQQNGALNGFARVWAGAFGIPTNSAQATKYLDDLGTKADQSRKKVTGLQKDLQRLGTGAGLAVLAKQTTDMADIWTRSRNLLSAVGVSTADLKNQQGELVEMAIRTRTALEPTVSLYSRMYRSLIPLGAAQADIARATEITNMAFKAGGAAVSEQNAAILQLSQALGAGLLQGDELRSVRENAPLIAKAIADEFGTTIAGLKKLGEQGQLTTERVFKGILEGGKAIEAQFGTTIPTIADSFVNLRTRMIEYIGGANEATGASQLLTGVINMVANNLNILIDALIVAATVMAVNFARNAAAALIASLIQMRAQMIAVNVMFAATPVAATAASRGVLTLASGVGILRGALAALMGPIGIILAVGTALGVMAISAQDATDEMERMRAEFQKTDAEIQNLTASVDDFAERRANRIVGDFGDLNKQVETAAERVVRLQKQHEELSLKKYEEELKKAHDLISQTRQQMTLLKMSWDEFKGDKTSDASIANYNKGLTAMKENLAEAEAARDRLLELGPAGADEKSEKAYIQAVYDEYEFREFAARNHEAKLIQVLTEKIDTAKRLFGNESDEYIRAVTEKEAAEAKFKRTREQSAKDTERALRDSQKDQLEALDTQMEAAEDNKDESLRIMAEKVAMLKQFYGEDSREYQRGLQEQTRMLRKFLNEENAMRRDMIDRDAEIAEGKASTELDLLRGELQRKQQIIESGVQAGILSEQQAVQMRGILKQQEIAAEIAHQHQVFTIQRNALQEMLAMEGLRPQERQRILNQLVQMEAEHNNQLAILKQQSAHDAEATQRDAAKAAADSWKNILQPVGGAINGMFSNLYNGTMGFRDAFVTALDDILFSFVSMGIQMATNWAAQQLGMTAATTAGVAARTSAEAAGAATTSTISAGAALGQIMNYAWTAAAGAFSAMAGIPIIGPVLAVGAAAAAIAAVLGFAGNLFSAEGGFGEVPADGTITELHKEEMVLPAKFANPLRNMLGGFGVPATPGTVSATAGEQADFFRQQNNVIQEGDTILNYNPVSNVNNVSLSQLLRRDGLAMKKWLQAEQRNKAGGRPKQSA